MKTFQDYYTDEFIVWLRTKSLSIKKINENLYIIFNSKYCLKIYDRIGHGNGVTVNLSQFYNETIYADDNYSLYWAFKYFGSKMKSDFSSRNNSTYEKNLPLLIHDLKNIITFIEKTDEKFWQKSLEWINENAKKID